MTDLSPEQQSVVDAPLVPLSVIACAGSGKTRTAVSRLVEIRRRLGASRGHVVLLSFSNVAVQRFQKDYLTLLKRLPDAVGRTRVAIETADSFITAWILRPHAQHTMGSPGTPFLIMGAEPFLQNERFTFWATRKAGDPFPVPAASVGVSLVDGKPRFSWSPRGGGAPLPVYNGRRAAEQLGAVGGYTHDIGRYWAYQTLQEQPWVLRALARRYPHILVDEAQDVGTMHQAILELLVGAGAQVSLIGDPDQAIYEFAGAEGTFLTEYASQTNAASFGLNRNFRSVPAIVAVANAVAKRSAAAHRSAPASQNGAFFVPYGQTAKQSLVKAFQSCVASTGLSLTCSAVVTRSRDLADELRGTDSEHGQGLVRGFATAAVMRDVRADYLEAFKVVAGCVVALLSKPADRLLHKILNPAHYSDVKQLRRVIWVFVRDSDKGLPSASLIADAEWHPLLVERVKTLLESIRDQFGFQSVDHLGNRLAKKKLPRSPLAGLHVVEVQDKRIRIETVHQVKGECLDAVLYVATKRHALALANGVGTEDGRIGYVALTRARDLFWLGVPNDSLAELREPLLGLGFREWAVQTQG